MNDMGVTPAKAGWLRRWLERHRHPASFWLHMVGIPLTIAAVAVALVQLKLGQWDLWWRPVVLLAVGYFVQWLGHRIEGNDMGEVILVKRMLGRPYVAVSERYGERDREGNAETPKRRDAESPNAKSRQWK